VYNHGDGDDQNVKFVWKNQERVIQVVAIQDIKKNSEVLHSYGSNYNKFDREVQ
tara:strand:- start:388 stop:549 length:162 start_codon:yes stop_codon:yes gene_type:complete